jgi:hypothetical protein
VTARIAVETLTLNEVSDLFRKSFEIAFPKSRGAIAHKMKKIKKAKVSNHKWVQTYEEFKGAKLNFYCEKVNKEDNPIISIGMTHRTSKGLILITFDNIKGGVPLDGINRNLELEQWVRIYTGHFCERYARRIMKVESPTFKIGSEGVMFSDLLGPARVTAIISEDVEEIEFQFNKGQCYGYRDHKSKIVFYKTVYSNDMLTGDRLSFKEEWKDSISQLHELFKKNS